MSRLPGLNGAGSRSTRALLRHSNRIILENGGVSDAPVKASCPKPSAFAPLATLPWAPSPADVRPKRPTTAARLTKRHLQPLAPPQAGSLAANQINGSISLVPAPPAYPKPTRRRKEVSFIDVLKKYNRLPHSRTSSPLSPSVSPERPTDLVRILTKPDVGPTNHLCRSCSPLLLSKELCLPDPRFNNVIVLSMPGKVHPVGQAVREMGSLPGARSGPLVHRVPLLARRAARDAPKLVPFPAPCLLPVLGQGYPSLVSAKAFDQAPK